MNAKRPISLADLRWMLGMSRSDLARSLGITASEVEKYEPEWQSMPPKLKLMALMLMKLHQAAAEQHQTCPFWALNTCPTSCTCCPRPAARQFLAASEPEEPTSWERCEQCTAGKSWFRRLSTIPSSTTFPVHPESN